MKAVAICHMRILARLIAFASAVAGTFGFPPAVPDTAARFPVLVELFTSEGCSSCPPIDALVQRIDASQPLPNVQLIVLSEHVDYWDHDGWKDPYSSSSFTERQEQYVRALKLDEPYTPQIIINGNEVVRSYSSPKITEAFQSAGTTPTIPVRIGSLRIENSNQPLVRARIEVDGGSAPRNADVYLAIALDHAESQVSAGENNGKRLAHVAVVEYLKKVGKLDAGKPFAQDCQARLKKTVSGTDLRIVAFVQEPGPGKVLGTALRKLSPDGSTTP